ncbi:MAG: elongation factor Ts [Parcubacteria group bacterium]|nr:elongation factor Ts [Parcubacteria group bacterium]
MVSTDQVKELRDKTGISVMQCKKALEDAGGDMNKALEMLKAKGAEIASKKSARALKAGAVASYVHSNNAVGAMVLLSCETDFVARNEEFKTLAYDIAMHITAMSPEFVSAKDITTKHREKARELFNKEVDESGKPSEIKEKMLAGKIGTYFKERTLLDQQFIKDGEKTISDLITNAIQKFGENIEVAQFVRFSV